MESELTVLEKEYCSEAFKAKSGLFACFTADINEGCEEVSEDALDLFFRGAGHKG